MEAAETAERRRSSEWFGILVNAMMVDVWVCVEIVIKGWCNEADDCREWRKSWGGQLQDVRDGDG